jgi:hypothetical protein
MRQRITLWRHRTWLAEAEAEARSTLPAARAAAFARHAAGCARCRETVDLARASRTLLAALPPAEAPRSFRLTPDAVVATPPRAAARRPAASRFVQAAGGLAAAAAVGFAAVVAVDVSQGTSAGPTRDSASVQEASPQFSAESAGKSGDRPQVTAGSATMNSSATDAGATATASAASASGPALAPAAADAPSVPAPQPPAAGAAPTGDAAHGRTASAPSQPLDATLAEGAAPAGGDDNGYRAAEIGLAALALGGVGAAGVALVRRRRRPSGR